MKISVIMFIAFIVLIIGGYFVFITNDNNKQKENTEEIKTQDDIEQSEFYKSNQSFKQPVGIIAKYDSSVIASNSNVYRSEQKNTNINLKSDISKLPLSTLIKKGGSYQCTWNYQNQNNSQISGVSFISNSMALIELMGTINNTNYKTFFLTRGGYIYYWSTSMPDNGFKTKVINQNLNSEKIGYSIADDEIIRNPSYHCQLWNNPSIGTFTVPKLNFKEI